MTGGKRCQSNVAGRRLRQIRHARGKTLEVVAGLAGISPSHLCRLETGVCPLDRLSVIVALAEALHIAPSELISLQLAAEPVELGSLALQLDEGPLTAEIDGSEPESERTRPLRTAGLRFERYTSAIKYLSPPTLFESRPSYRLLDVSLASRRLSFGLGAYFEKLDVGEAVAHEIAAVYMADGMPGSAEKLRGRLPLRELIGDPFDPRRRAMTPGIATLTIRLRRYPTEPSFLLLWRDSVKVATSGGTYGAIPTGEFQPSSVGIWERHSDFDLWRNMVREYSEELLGEPEYDGTRSQPIDYEQWPLFQRLQAARADGSVGVFFLGLGLNALTLGATILTVVVIDDDVFTEVFGSTVRFNDKGEIVAVGGGPPTEGVPFTETAVRRMLETEPMTPIGRGLPGPGLAASRGPGPVAQKAWADSTTGGCTALRC